MGLSALGDDGKACLPLHAADVFGAVPFLAQTAESFQRGVLIGPCLDDGDCEVGDLHGVSYAVLGGIVLGKTVGVDASLPFGLTATDTPETVGQKLFQSAGAEAHITASSVTAGLCNQAAAWFEAKFVGGRLVSVGLYAQP